MLIAYIFIGLTAVVIFLRWGLRIGSSSPAYQPQPKNQQNNPGAPSSTTTEGTTPTPSTPPPPTPTPAPVTTPRSYSWQWWLVIIAVIALLVWWGYKVHVYAPPRVNAPTEMRRVVVQRLLVAESKSGDCVSFRVDDVPWASNARYQIAFKLIQYQPGNLFVEVNGRTGDKGRLFSFDSRLCDREITVVFFEDASGGLQGKAAYFKPGTNQIVFRSPGINVKIIYAQIEVEYWS